MRLHSKYTIAPFLWLPAVLASGATPKPPSVFERKFELDGQGCEDIQWTVDQENLKLVLSWKSIVAAEWTAFGITNFGTMKGADMAVVKFIAEDGKFVVEDRYSKDTTFLNWT